MKYLIKILIFLSLFCFIIGCNSTTNLRVRSLGFLSCDLIFSVHDNCKEIPEKLHLKLSFESDHAGVSFARDNLTLTFEDFGETDQHECKHTREIRVPYNIETHGAQDFTWKILKDGEPWEKYEVIVNECNETDLELEDRYKLMQMESKEKLKTEIALSGKIPEKEEKASVIISQDSQLKEIEETASKAVALQEIQGDETSVEPRKTEMEKKSSSEGKSKFRGLFGYGSFSESESSLFGYRAFWHNWGIGQSLWDFKNVTPVFNLEIDSISLVLNYRFEIPKSFIPLDLGGDGNDLTLGIGLVSSGKAKMLFAGSDSETEEIVGFDVELLFGQQHGSVEWLLGFKLHNRTFKNLKYGDSTYSQSLSWLNFQSGAGWLF